MKNSEIVEEAAEAIERHGWIRGAYGNTTTGFCLNGAAMHAKALNGLSVMAPGKVVAPGLPDSYLSTNPIHPEFVGVAVTVYNDYYCTSKEEALGVLDRAAKHWRNLGE